MSILGHKPAGYSVSLDLKGNKLEKEYRQCVHCQFTWEYIPGSGAKRGFCLKCFGLTCGRLECLQAGCNGSFEKALDQREKKTRKFNGPLPGGPIILVPRGRS